MSCLLPHTDFRNEENAFRAIIIWAHWLLHTAYGPTTRTTHAIATETSRHDQTACHRRP